jgi:hypothetical protein
MTYRHTRVRELTEDASSKPCGPHAASSLLVPREAPLLESDRGKRCETEAHDAARCEKDAVIRKVARHAMPK